MADDLIKEFGSWMLIVVFLGSFVDLVQCGWIFKRYMNKRRRRLESNIRAKIIVEEFDRRRTEKEIRA
jgi:putative effector of murein hydrolase LrgA (UPF0299 family)